MLYLIPVIGTFIRKEVQELHVDITLDIQYLGIVDLSSELGHELFSNLYN